MSGNKAKLDKYLSLINYYKILTHKTKKLTRGRCYVTFPGRHLLGGSLGRRKSCQGFSREHGHRGLEERGCLFAASSWPGDNCYASP